MGWNELMSATCVLLFLFSFVKHLGGVDMYHAICILAGRSCVSFYITETLAHTVQPHPFGNSHPMHLYSQHDPSYIGAYTSHHTLLQPQPSLLDFLGDFHSFRYAYHFQAHALSDLSNRRIAFMRHSTSCAFFADQMSPRKAGLTTILYTVHLLFTFILLSH